MRNVNWIRAALSAAEQDALAERREARRLTREGSTPVRMNAEDRAVAIKAKAERRVDRELRKAANKARRRWRDCTMDFADGCVEEYDRRGQCVGFSKGPRHDPSMHKGVRTPEGILLGRA